MKLLQHVYKFLCHEMRTCSDEIEFNRLITYGSGPTSSQQEADCYFYITVACDWQTLRNTKCIPSIYPKQVFAHNHFCTIRMAEITSTFHCVYKFFFNKQNRLFWTGANKFFRRKKDPTLVTVSVFLALLILCFVEMQICHNCYASYNREEMNAIWLCT